MNPIEVLGRRGQEEGYAALGCNAFQSVTQTHYYDTQQSNSTTGMRALVIENEASDAASITARAQCSSVILSATNASFVIGEPRVRTGGRSSGFGGARFKINPDDLVILVYGPNVGASRSALWTSFGG